MSDANFDREFLDTVELQKINKLSSPNIRIEKRKKLALQQVKKWSKYLSKLEKIESNISKS